ncbi:MAG TPA: hypothetical protein VFA27_07895 [Vicinamibacterales bacterium]|nr:hypothetical protein [Vicinamibacterales bacterium]
MKHIWTDELPKRPGPTTTRAAERKPIALPARLTWKDQRGMTRFATVVTKNVSEYGVYVECQSPVSIPLFRLVQFQLERDVRSTDALPESLQQGRILSAVYRVSPPSSTNPQGLALRLMVDPRRAATSASASSAQVLAS